MPEHGLLGTMAARSEQLVPEGSCESVCGFMFLCLHSCLFRTTRAGLKADEKGVSRGKRPPRMDDTARGVRCSKNRRETEGELRG